MYQRLLQLAGPLQGRNYRYLWFGQAISQLGDWMNRVGLIVLVYQLTGQTTSVAVLLLSQLLPRALLLPIGGVLVDRWPKRQLMISTDVARAVIAGSFVLITALPTALGLPILCTLVVALQVFTSLFNPARSAATPALVSSNELATANSLNGITSNFAMLIGPSIGSLLLIGWGVNAVFLGNAATFLLSAFFIALLHFNEPVSRSPRRESMIQALREGATVVLHIPILWTVFGGICLVVLANLCLQVTLVDLLVDPLGQSTAALGPLLTAVGLGGIPGSILGGWIVRHRWALQAYGIALILFGLDTVLVAIVRSYQGVLIALLINGILSLTLDVIGETITAQVSPTERIGSIFGLQQWTTTLGHVAGAVVGGSLPLILGTPSTIAAVGATILIIATVGLLWDSFRRLGQMDNQTAR